MSMRFIAMSIPGGGAVCHHGLLKAEYNLGYVWLISAVAAMGGLLFGWDWVVIGGAKPFFQRYFQLTTEAQIGWANSCASSAVWSAHWSAGGLSDKFGRKRLLIVAL
jgi:MFS transporter, SP family, xylose:H+ symportor